MSDLQDIAAYLEGNNTGGTDLTENYTFKLFRWSDQDLTDASTRFMVLRPNSGGLVDRDLGRPAFAIIIVGTKNDDPEDGYSRAELIRDTMISDYKTGCIIQFQFLSDIVGPIYLEDDRPMYEINFTALTSRSS